MNNEKWLTVEEMCNCLHLSKDTINKWIEQRDMYAHRVGRWWMKAGKAVVDSK